jgi:hypothetical protein
VETSNLSPFAVKINNNNIYISKELMKYQVFHLQFQESKCGGSLEVRERHMMCTLMSLVGIQELCMELHGRTRHYSKGI